MRNKYRFCIFELSLYFWVVYFYKIYYKKKKRGMYWFQHDESFLFVHDFDQKVGSNAWWTQVRCFSERKCHLVGTKRRSFFNFSTVFRYIVKNRAYKCKTPLSIRIVFRAYSSLVLRLKGRFLYLTIGVSPVLRVLSYFCTLMIE